jgi:hypothetical protein
MKAVISFEYKYYVMDAQKALQFVQLLEGMERYDSKFNKDTNSYNFYVYEEEAETISEIKLISDHQYRVAKAAGRPEK